MLAGGGPFRDTHLDESLPTLARQRADHQPDRAELFEITGQARATGCSLLDVVTPEVNLDLLIIGHACLPR